MRNTIVRCGRCGAALTIPDATGAGEVDCRSCGATTGVWLFPALHRTRSPEQAQPILEEGHSSCLSHPQKRAVAVCDGCGRFMCALCDVDWNGEHLCPTCIAHRKSADHEGTLRTEYFHYDLIALLLALVAIPTSFMGVFIAPIVIFLGVRYWKAPWRPVPYRKWTMVLAVLLATMAMVGWISIFAFAILSPEFS
jgi:uncharacterized paraquat-inducible protein A